MTETPNHPEEKKSSSEAKINTAETRSVKEINRMGENKQRRTILKPDIVHGERKINKFRRYNSVETSHVNDIKARQSHILGDQIPIYDYNTEHTASIGNLTQTKPQDNK